jgi:hypothetical protein
MYGQASVGRDDRMNGNRSSKRCPVARARLDQQRASKRLEPVLHVGQASTPHGSGHIEPAAVIGNLDKQVLAILVEAHLDR